VKVGEMERDGVFVTSHVESGGGSSDSATHDGAETGRDVLRCLCAAREYLSWWVLWYVGVIIFTVVMSSLFGANNIICSTICRHWAKL
jgi:hypothetical protein